MMALEPGVSYIQHTHTLQEGRKTAVMRRGIPQIFVEVNGKMIQMIKTPNGEELVVIPRKEYDELVAKARPPEHVRDAEIIAGRLNKALENNDPKVFVAELIEAVKAKGVMSLIDEVGVDPTILYDGLSNPKFFTVLKILRGFGLRLTVMPK